MLFFESGYFMEKKSKYNTLILIGNGFDRWQGLSTSYEDFRKYYYKNIKRVLDEMKIAPFSIEKNGIKKNLTPVELVYGNIFSPDNLSNEFFWNFENSTALIDDQLLSSYFGTSNQCLYGLQKIVEAAQNILQKIFGEWAASIDITPIDSGYVFQNNCYVVNFNYTDTLEKRFGVTAENDYHIHGDAMDPESIIFGHATHPEIAFPELMEQRIIKSIDGGKSKRLQGLYLIESALFETDKHVQDNIDDLSEFMILDGVHIEDIENVYVLGHSFGEPDFEYFKFLNAVTKKDADLNSVSASYELQNIIDRNGGNLFKDTDELKKFIILNIEYASNHRQLQLNKPNLSFPKGDKIEYMLKSIGCRSYNDIYSDEERKNTVHIRFLLEQDERTNEILDELWKLKHKEERSDYVKETCRSVLKLGEYMDGGHNARSTDAHWHITYHSSTDKDRIENVMRKIGCNNYTLYSTIDECIKCFKR